MLMAQLVRLSSSKDHNAFVIRKIDSNSIRALTERYLSLNYALFLCGVWAFTHIRNVLNSISEQFMDNSNTSRTNIYATFQMHQRSTPKWDKSYGVKLNMDVQWLWIETESRMPSE